MLTSITGKKELIKVKGNQVAPAELEGLLLDHQATQDAAVVGVTMYANLPGVQEPQLTQLQKRRGAATGVHRPSGGCESHGQRHCGLVGAESRST